MMKQLCAAGLALAFILPGCAAEPERAGAPDVRGVNLADANKMLKQAGFNSTITDNDALFGVIVEANFVVCDQDDTTGKLVPLKVAKHGC